MTKVQPVPSSSNPTPTPKPLNNETMWLGHFWKCVDQDCYKQCKEFHGFEGQVCFWVCVTPKHVKK